MTLFLSLLIACCGQTPPVWMAIDPVTTAVGVDIRLDLADYVDDDPNTEHTFSMDAEPGVAAKLAGSTLTLSGEEDFDGYARVSLAVTDPCGVSVETSLSVKVVASDGAGSTGCPAEVRVGSSASTVAIAGSFNAWSIDANGMVRDGDEFVATLFLAPGAYAYKVVEDGTWRCDAGAGQAICEAGQTWDPSCPSGENNCNSLLIVPDCSVPQLTLSALEIDRTGNGVTVTGGADKAVSGEFITLDGEDIAGWNGKEFSVAQSGLTEGRHTIRIGAEGTEPIYIPFWTDDFHWEDGLLYFIFVDRFADGSGGNEAEGADVDYAGGDWRGALAQLDALAELGVTTLWITSPLDNAEGDWSGQCGATYAGYHGYWPDSTALEEHFGDDAAWKALIDGAHDRGMRVMVDWVANHVHSNHLWVTEHPAWFNERHICEQDDDGDGQLNWDQRPLTCWFASYLPDIDYYQLEPTVASIDLAIAQAKEWEIDGFRVDAVKHMPDSVMVDLETRISAEIEHRLVGGDEDFRTVGETFDGAATIARYVTDRELDAQFDFPLYFAIVSAFARDEVGLSSGEGSLAAAVESSRTAYGGALMSTFLGNHDVARFIAQASGEVGSLYGDSPCDGNGDLVTPDLPPGWSEPYDRLKLAWTFLLTTEGQPLVYYGDEVGLPGYADPDNRQTMRFDGELSDDEASVRAHVSALAAARREHPALARGTFTTWWEGEADVWAYARVLDGDGVLVIFNRAEAEVTLTNGLAFAGLPEGAYVDVNSGGIFYSVGDALQVTIPPMGSRVLVAP